jgi:hypothetical protein
MAMSVSGRQVAVAETPASGVRQWLPTVVGGILGYLLVRMLGTTAVRMLGGLLVGALVGLIPYMIAKSRGNPRLGRTALLFSSLAGVALGILLAAPVALGFVVWAWPRKPAGK